MKSANPISIRLPARLKDKVKAQAHDNYRSLSGEIIAILSATLNEKGQHNG